MYTPPYTVTEEALHLLIEIGALIPRQQSAATQPHLSVQDVCEQHAALGGSGQLRTSGLRPHWVAILLSALLDWTQHTQSHPLISSAVLHYELMSIQPFDSGNARLAEQLQRRMLAAIHPRLSGLEANISSQDYNLALAAPDATELITLSLRAILAALRTHTPPRARPPRKPGPAEQLLAHLRRHPGSKRHELLNALPGLSSRMLDRHLHTLKENGQIEYRGARKNGAYYPTPATR